ncbi:MULTISPECIES: helix-turn-helix domain-containing protein [unclassified Saccharothrix]|uniref:helix-turn-helix domain-containing protein n=1 Tax=unclassified Saccharothrix TaxID=2593673 RepID=UPI00307E1A96
MSSHRRRRPVSPFWSYLEARMERAGLTTSDLVRAVGVHRSRLTDWRRGRSVSVETARALAGLFGVSLLEVLVAAGVISAEEADARPLREAGAVSDDLLLVELRRRLAAREEQEPR